MYKNDQYLIDLYLEQIKYLYNENISIQNQFLSGTNLPLAALGILIFYIEESAEDAIKSLYLLLPFLYLLIPYNLIKYSTRMLSINGYIKHLEKQINILMNRDVFLWNGKLINCSCFPGGFSTITTIGQIPIHIITISFLILKFIETIRIDTIFVNYHIFLSIALIIEGIVMILMLLDAAFIQRIILKRINKLAVIPPAYKSDIVSSSQKAIN